MHMYDIICYVVPNICIIYMIHAHWKFLRFGGSVGPSVLRFEIGFISAANNTLVRVPLGVTLFKLYDPLNDHLQTT